jgi:hypothetical protein
VHDASARTVDRAMTGSLFFMPHSQHGPVARRA